jgi:hypothetical protein
MGRKRTSVLIGCIILIFSLSACGGKGTGESGGDVGGGGVSTPVVTASPKDGQNTIRGTCGFEAASVLAITPDPFSGGAVDKWPVAKDGSFSAYAYPRPTALLFLNSNDQPVGHLVFQNGMTSYSLENLFSSDLGTLRLSSSIVTPGRDPFADGELGLNQAEQSVLRVESSAFSSVVLRPDTDGNGKMDLLEGKFYFPYMGYYINGTFSNGSLTGQVTVPITFDRFDLCFQDQSLNASFPASGVNFSGPPASALDATPARIDTSTGRYCSANIPGGAAMPAGTYTATYNGGTLGFEIPDQPTAAQEILVVVPTVKLNSDDTIASLGWTYRLGDGTNQGNIDPAKVITGLRIYMSTPTTGDRAYDSEDISPDVTTHVLPTNKPRPKWSDVTRVEIDLYTKYDGCIIFYYSKPKAV